MNSNTEISNCCGAETEEILVAFLGAPRAALRCTNCHKKCTATSIGRLLSRIKELEIDNGVLRERLTVPQQASNSDQANTFPPPGWRVRADSETANYGDKFYIGEMPPTFLNDVPAPLRDGLGYQLHIHAGRIVGESRKCVKDEDPSYDVVIITRKDTP